MQIRDIHLLVLNEMTEEDFAGWFVYGFANWNVPETRHQSFCPIQFVISPTGEILPRQIAEVYEHLNEKSKVCFINGAMKALDRCLDKGEHFDVAWMLVAMFVTLKNDQFIDVLGKYVFGKDGYLSVGKDNHAKEDLGSRIIGWLTSLRSYKTHNFLLALLKSYTIDPRNTPMIFKSLCRRCPEKRVLYYVLISPYLSVLERDGVEYRLG